MQYKSTKLGYRQRMLYREGVRQIPGTAHGAFCDCHQPTKLLNKIPIHLARQPLSLSLSLSFSLSFLITLLMPIMTHSLCSFSFSPNLDYLRYGTLLRSAERRVGKECRSPW